MAPVPAAASRYDPSQFNKEHNAKTDKGSYTVSRKNSDQSEHQEFLPTWDPLQKFPPLQFFKHHDKGVFGDAHYANLASQNPGYTHKSITPKFGTEINGIQLSQLTEAGKNDLALLIARRGVVVFRDQDLSAQGPKFAVRFGEHFGPLHIHPTSGAPDGIPQLHVTFKGLSKAELENAFSTRTNNIAWHSDVSYEINPPSYTFFSVIQGPETGGDTIFADTVEAYRRLSPVMQGMLAGLTVVHSGLDQAAIQKKNGGILRREPVETVHPLVRTHPVTGEKFLFVNREFLRRIVQLKEEESEALLEFLYRTIEGSHDLQLRASWDNNTVVCWDNRRTVHSAVIDWNTPVLRHAFRISPQGERPVENLKDLNDDKYLA